MTDIDDHSVEPLAIVGMAVRAPGADTLEEFWRNLVEGRESVTTFSDEEQVALDPAHQPVSLSVPTALAYTRSAATMSAIRMNDSAAAAG